MECRRNCLMPFAITFRSCAPKASPRLDMHRNKSSIQPTKPTTSSLTSLGRDPSRQRGLPGYSQVRRSRTGRRCGGRRHALLVEHRCRHPRPPQEHGGGPRIWWRSWQATSLGPIPRISSTCTGAWRTGWISTGRLAIYRADGSRSSRCLEVKLHSSGHRLRVSKIDSHERERLKR